MLTEDILIWEGLGFPIRLISVPMKKVFGEWVLDINLAHFQKVVLLTLTKKSSPISGAELRFIIDYLKMSTREFAQLFGVTHAAVLKWENEKSRMNPSTEVCLRLYILNHLKIADKEFRKSYLKISHQNLSHSENVDIVLEIDANKIACSLNTLYKEVSMKTQISLFDQAQKNVWEVLWDNPQIPKWKMDALLVLFGNLALKSKLSKKERTSDPLYTFDLERTINDITKLMGDSEELKQIWSQNRSTIILSLAD